MIIYNLNREQSNLLYLDVLKDRDVAVMRELCKADLFFLLSVVCNRKDIDRDWLFDRCREVQQQPNGYLDLWAREHYKSTLITFGKSIQDILINPNITIGIFSHTRPIAKAFLDQIKRELETNELLKELFPDVLYVNPQKDSPKWSLDTGIIVKRDQNPKECTIEAHGLVDGQPTSRHFSLLIYDDVVTRESVTTAEQINKTTDALALSYNLGADGGVKRFIGTRYHMNDTYKVVMDRGTAIARIYPATDDGTATGKPVLLTQNNLNEKYRDMGVYIFSAQMLQNPASDKAMSFREEWLMNYYEIDWKKMNRYIVVDPAGEKKKDSDYTVMLVVGLGKDNNYYLIDGLRDRLSLTEKSNKLFDFVKKYNPLNVGYEKYGLQSDIEHIKYIMEKEGYRFRISEIGGSIAKNDRIRGLVPLFEDSRVYLPTQCNYIDYQGKLQDLMVHFKDEYLAFPVSRHDDILDCFARITDSGLSAKFPKIIDFNVSNKTMADYNVI